MPTCPRAYPNDFHEETVEPTFRTPFVSHQTHPSTVLALTAQMFGVAPEAILLSLVGYDFDFGEGLSDATAALVPQAVTRILELVAQPGPASTGASTAGEAS